MNRTDIVIVFAGLALLFAFLGAWLLSGIFTGLGITFALGDQNER